MHIGTLQSAVAIHYPTDIKGRDCTVESLLQPQIRRYASDYAIGTDNARRLKHQRQTNETPEKVLVPEENRVRRQW